jgi:hypothetical protein
MLRLAGEQVESLFDEALPIEVRELPADLARLDVLLDDPALLEPIAARWEVAARDRGRPTIAMLLFVRARVRGVRVRPRIHALTLPDLSGLDKRAISFTPLRAVRHEHVPSGPARGRLVRCDAPNERTAWLGAILDHLAIVGPPAWTPGVDCTGLTV